MSKAHVLYYKRLEKHIETSSEAADRILRNSHLAALQKQQQDDACREDGFAFRYKKAVAARRQKVSEGMIIRSFSSEEQIVDNALLFVTAFGTLQNEEYVVTMAIDG